jgi:hypothetical protein
VIELRAWLASTRFPNRPWLVLGKGPTIDRRDEFDLTAYNRVSINHAVRLLDVDVAHIVDIDVVVECADVLAQRAKWLLMPRHPHVAQRAGHALLEDYVAHIPVLRELDEEGRLVWYNAATSDPVGDSPVMSLTYFSSEAVFDILAEMGVREIHSLGIDGGSAYGSGLSGATLLANGQSSFDIQFRELGRIAAAKRITWRPLVEPMRVFIGVDDTQRIAARVLEHSLRRHASRPVVVEHLDQPPRRLPREKRNQPRTPFSFNRFRIPELAGFRGPALYLDSDMLVFGDVAEVFDLEFGDAQVLCTRQDEPPPGWATHSGFRPGRQFSVMLIDCERAHWDVDEIVDRLDAGALTYEQLMFDLAIVPSDEIEESIPPEWNHLERYEPGKTRLLHYTNVPTQPWRVATNPLGALWMDEYQRAVAASAVSVDEVAEAIARRWARKELRAARFVQPWARPVPLPANASPAEIELAAMRRELESGDRTLAGRVRRVLRRAERPGDLLAVARRQWLRARSGVRVSEPEPPEDTE